MNIMSNRTEGEAIEDKTIIADYERGITGAAKEVFEDVQIYGCLFHFRQVVST
jgi:hypothetical protein